MFRRLSAKAIRSVVKTATAVGTVERSLGIHMPGSLNRS